MKDGQEEASWMRSFREYHYLQLYCRVRGVEVSDTVVKRDL